MESDRINDPGQESFQIGAESFALTLTLGGRYAGEQTWTVHPERSALIARVETNFGGVLPEVRRVQSSRMHARTFASHSYSEGDGRGKPSFETTFDRKNGVLTLRQGKDEVTTPLLGDHHDPVSLLLWLRGQHGQDVPPQRLTGGRVHVQTLHPAQGGDVNGTPTHVYLLRPGHAYVYVEQDAPHRLLRLIQPTDFGPVEANLPQARRQAQPERRRRRAG
ncbi:DUF3108 domain-containing protein [Deinococcus sp. QL22]|uniref:DUF3108 domain-containing protein n=1 Tax=Deinococcus sp. QL22 TaxID=2939437 RepID=UPI0020173C68|nr:DUF3108 domain-containing protein [Deinococcus sp. QL22]UQN06943.1 DUF3108 domain-containing protein [Deinococcus sp. QL22]